MTEFRVTFGGKYRDRPHPVVPYAHPDGWVAVEADDATTARRLTVALLGASWGDLYDPATDGGLMIEWLVMFPRGELARIHADGSVTVTDPYAELAELRKALQEIAAMAPTAAQKRARRALGDQP